jgi:periplasmic protein TonB
MISHEEIEQIRAQDRQKVFVAALFAAVLHYFAIMAIAWPYVPPKAFDVPAPRNLVFIHPFVPPGLTEPLPVGGASSPEAAVPPARVPASAAPAPSSDAVPPKVLELATPQIPEDARLARVRGIVRLEVLVRADGSVGDIRVHTGLSKSCDAAAIEAARRSKFLPGTVQGRPVDAILTVDLRFQ